MEEKWAAISGYSGRYWVSNRGAVKSFCHKKKEGRHLKLLFSSKGYPRCVLCTSPGVLRGWFVHRLVAQEFIGPRPEGGQVNHKNGIFADNNVANLEWVTAKENREHATKLASHTAIRETHPMAKLKNEDVLEIRKLISAGVSDRKIGRKYGVTKTAIWMIRNKRSWKTLE